MDCKHIKNQISAYLDNELQPKEREQVKNHLNLCSDCCREFELMEKNWKMLKNLDMVEPSQNYISRFWSELSSRQTWYQKAVDVVKNIIFARRLVFVYALICVVIGALALRNYFQVQQTNQMIVNFSSDDYEMVEYIELAENYDIIKDIEFFEDFEVIESL